jgi:hypothetical protein
VTRALFPFVILLASCASKQEQPSKYPPQKEGCEVQVFQETPTVQTDNIGPVSSSCDQDVSDQDCLRTLKDEACKLGGNVVWGVEPNPTKQLGKKKFFGRAAHTK